MNFPEYINQKKELYSLLYNFIESRNEVEVDFQILVIYVETVENMTKKEDLLEFLYMILKISENHSRTLDFFSKIEQILLHLEIRIKKNLSNWELFNIFQSNKRILLFLFSQKLLKMDNFIKNILMKKSDENGTKYRLYFQPEIDSSKEDDEKSESAEYGLQNLSDFDKNRQIGENDTFLCKLIRNDSIQEFESYVKRSNISLTSKIERSIFETNRLLIKSNPTLIEYAAFFGSLKVFKYLKENGVKLTPSLWIYSIHSKNAELIKILEDNKIELDDKNYLNCLKESIKCHHNKFAYYIKNYLIKSNNESDFNNKVSMFGFKYHNYAYFPSNFDQKNIFYNACKYNYIKIVEYLNEVKKYNIYETISIKYLNKVISKTKFFLNEVFKL